MSATSEPRTQALNFWNQIKDKEFQIIPVLDVERNEKAPLENLSESYAKEFIQAFREISGQDIIIYSGRCYIEEYFSLEFRQNNNWWVADYSANEAPSIIGCSIVGWQYSEDEISFAFTLGELDCSILLDESKFFISENLPYSEEGGQLDSDIEALQSELNNQGFKDKNGNSLKLDGIAGELTLSACPLLKIGSNGEITKWVQKELNDNIGYLILVDGIFGSQTYNAVVTYQENMSLIGDGIVGKNTWRKLLGM